jgi:hypothetical protein
MHVCMIYPRGKPLGRPSENTFRVESAILARRDGSRVAKHYHHEAWGPLRLDHDYTPIQNIAQTVKLNVLNVANDS